MERKIMFRGKAIYGELAGKWVYGDLAHDCNGKTLINIEGYSAHGTGVHYRHLVAPETVGQLTGLKDKTGHDIYEDDIITSDDIHTRAIKWNSYECKFNAVEWGIDKAIILGNIHDNPELLKSDEHE